MGTMRFSVGDKVKVRSNDYSIAEEPKGVTWSDEMFEDSVKLKDRKKIETRLELFKAILNVLSGEDVTLDVDCVESQIDTLKEQLKDM